MKLISEMWVWPSAVTKESCEAIIKTIESRARTSAAIGDNSEVLDDKYRNTEVCWVSETDPLSLILFNHILIANQKAGWYYDIDAVEQVQLAKYSPGAKYKLHQDSSTTQTPPRKASAVLMLSDPSAYTGGRLLLGATPTPTEVPNTQGTIVVFPSATAHEVTEVTAGVRYTAVAWARGPNWI